MAHAIWTGTISFGLVTIPVKLFTAVRANDVKFNFLHKADEGRVRNDRHCSLCEEKIEYADLVRGYEYEKGRYVIISDDDLKHVNVEATQSVEIVEFVELSQINPMYFDTPYYLEPEKKGRHAYALLRESLLASGKVGIAKVVIRSREHLAALKPNGEALLLELMHYAEEIVPQEDLNFPSLNENVTPAELKMANMLIDSMTKEKFEPEQFHDTYRDAVMAMIETRAAGKELPPAEPVKKAPSNVVDLMDVLQRSLEAQRSSSIATIRGETTGSDTTTSKAKAASKRKKNVA
jgi:DNA end-binding protein Ku